MIQGRHCGAPTNTVGQRLKKKWYSAWFHRWRSALYRGIRIFATDPLIILKECDGHTYLLNSYSRLCPPMRLLNCVNKIFSGEIRVHIPCRLEIDFRLNNVLCKILPNFEELFDVDTSQSGPTEQFQIFLYQLAIPNWWEVSGSSQWQA